MWQTLTCLLTRDDYPIGPLKPLKLFSVPKFLNLSGEVAILSLGLEWHCTQGSGEEATMFPSDPIINGAGQPAQTIRMAYFSIAGP